MSAIWKYVCGELPYSIHEMPVGARVLAVGVQDHVPVLWALVDPDADRETRTFQHIGTGHAFDPAGLEYVDTYELNLPGGAFVGHLFERTI